MVLNDSNLVASSTGEQTMDTDDVNDTPSLNGCFQWKIVGKNCVPCLLKSDGSKYVAVRIAESVVLNKYFARFNSEIFTCTSVKSFAITDAEMKLLNDINIRHCDKIFGNIPFTVEDDNIVKLDDLVEFHKFVDTCSEKLTNAAAAGTITNCGFIRINEDSVVPFVAKDNCRYVPIFYFEGETDNLLTKPINLEGWELAYLKFCCKVQGIKSELLSSDKCLVTSLDEIKSHFPEGTTFVDYWPSKIVELNEGTNARIDSPTNHCWIIHPPRIRASNTVLATATPSIVSSGGLQLSNDNLATSKNSNTFIIKNASSAIVQGARPITVTLPAYQQNNSSSVQQPQPSPQSNILLPPPNPMPAPQLQAPVPVQCTYPNQSLIPKTTSTLPPVYPSAVRSSTPRAYTSNIVPSCQRPQIVARVQRPQQQQQYYNMTPNNASNMGQGLQNTNGTEQISTMYQPQPYPPVYNNANYSPRFSIASTNSHLLNQMGTKPQSMTTSAGYTSPLNNSRISGHQAPHMQTMSPINQPISPNLPGVSANFGTTISPNQNQTSGMGNFNMAPQSQQTNQTSLMDYIDLSSPPRSPDPPSPAPNLSANGIPATPQLQYQQHQQTSHAYGNINMVAEMNHPVTPGYQPYSIQDWTIQNVSIIVINLDAYYNANYASTLVSIQSKFCPLMTTDDLLRVFLTVLKCRVFKGNSYQVELLKRNLGEHASENDLMLIPVQDLNTRHQQLMYVYRQRYLSQHS